MDGRREMAAFVGGELTGLSCGRGRRTAVCLAWGGLGGNDLASSVRATAGGKDVRALFRGRTLRASVLAQLTEEMAPGLEPEVPEWLLSFLCMWRFVQRLHAVIPNVRSIPNWMYRSRKRIRGTVVSVPDGDNFVLVHQPPLRPWYREAPGDDSSFKEVLETCIRVRLAGLDAPEAPFLGGDGQLFHREAKAYLEKMVLGKSVTVELVGRDRYARVIAVVYSGWGPFGRNINAAMLEEGLATIYRGVNRRYGDHFSFFQRMEQNAKAAGRNIWSVARMTTPAEYKRKLFERREAEKAKRAEAAATEEQEPSSTKRSERKGVSKTRAKSAKRATHARHRTAGALARAGGPSEE